MRIRPILFNGDMARAILDGRKTCTRRVIKTQWEECPHCKYVHNEYIYDKMAENVYCARCGYPLEPERRSPYQLEDILYVRETWGHPISLNLDFMVNVCKRDENVKLIAQSMKLPNGGNAQLDVGNNQEYILPFIGELRSLLNDNQAELEKVPDFREALEQFMFEMEEMSDYPWIELLWENEIKTRSNRVKFVFNYMNKSYCLIQYYYSNVLIGMERMNYVIEYIVNHRNDDTTQNE